LSAGQGVQSGGKDETRGKPNKNPLAAMALLPFVPGQAKSRAPYQSAGSQAGSCQNTARLSSKFPPVD
jgi:hypothetical protein